VATATNDNGVSISATSTPTAIVTDPAVVATGGFALKVTQGVDPGPQVVATFTDPGGPEPNTADHYSATINWGDGSAARAGTISFDAATSRFTVTGDHTYATIGTFTIITTINHEGVVSSATSSAVSSSSLEPGKVTGGGEIGKGRNLEIEAQSDDDDGPKGRPEGEVEYQDKANGINLHSTCITLVGVQDDGVHAVITGTATVNGVAGYSFTVTVADKGEPGIGKDQFRIQISGRISYDSNAFAANAGLLTSGNIQVHREKEHENEHCNSRDDSDRDKGRSGCFGGFASVALPTATIPVPTWSPAEPVIISTPPDLKTIQGITIFSSTPAQTLGGGSKPAGKTTGVASLLDEPGSDPAALAPVDETAFTLPTDPVRALVFDAGRMLDDGAEGFTFEGLASRLRLVAMAESAPVSTIVFDENSGEFVAVEALALRRWLEHGVVTDADSAKATPNVDFRTADDTSAVRSSAPVIHWTGSFADVRSPGQDSRA
jgi:hypothetical protein